jgi:hypothetical protein
LSLFPVVPAKGFPCEILLGARGDSVIPSFRTGRSGG